MRDYVLHLKCPHCQLTNRIPAHLPMGKTDWEGSHQCAIAGHGCGRRFYYRVQFSLEVWVTKMEVQTAQAHVTFSDEPERKVST